MKEIYTAKQVYVCSLCEKSILPGMSFKYLTKDYTDSEGHKAYKISKVHAYHEVKDDMP